MEEDGFTLVKNKRKDGLRSKNRLTGHKKSSHHKWSAKAIAASKSMKPRSIEGNGTIKLKLISDIQKAQTSIEASSFWSQGQGLLNNAIHRLHCRKGDHVLCKRRSSDLSGKPRNERGDKSCYAPYNNEQVDFNREEMPSELVCYGIGSLLDSQSARYQLAYALAVRKYLSLAPRTLMIYEPVLSPLELEVLQQEYECEIIGVDEEAKRSVTDCTLFFMPHCSARMYNNLLWANWDAKSCAKLIVVGNSFQRYHLCHLKRKLDREVPCLAQITEFVDELPLPAFEALPGAFNDTVIITFTRVEDPDVEVFSSKPPQPPPLSENFEL